jgi:hypothetical protein
VSVCVCGCANVCEPWPRLLDRVGGVHEQEGCKNLSFDTRESKEDLSKSIVVQKAAVNQLVLPTVNSAKLWPAPPAQLCVSVQGG